VDLAALARDRDQLWAEANLREAAGEETFVTPDVYDLFVQAQDKYSEADPWVEVIEEFIKTGDHKGKIPVTVLWKLVGVDSSRMRTSDAARMTSLMYKLGFKKQDKWEYHPLAGKVTKVYTRINPFDKENFDTSQSGAPTPGLEITYDEEQAAKDDAEYQRQEEIWGVLDEQGLLEDYSNEDVNYTNNITIITQENEQKPQ